MRENYVEKVLREGVKKLGGMAVKFVPLWFAGFPDRIVLLPGARIWFVETKAPGKKASKLQKAVHALLRRLGFEVLVLDTPEAVREFLKQIEII